MVTRARLLPLAVAAFGLAAASPALAADLGKNLAGETCQWSGSPAVDQPVSIMCGGATQPVATISVLPSQNLPRDVIARRSAIAQLSVAGYAQATCAPAKWYGATMLRTCTLNSNGWPRILIAREAAGRLYSAEGAPSALPAMQAAIAADSHVAATDDAALTDALSTELSASLLHASAADYAAYEKSTEAARLAGASDNYAAAEAGYRAALTTEQSLFGPNSLVVGQTLAELALQVSNQGRFVEAAALFHRAAPILEASSDNNVRGRYFSYLALDAANQRHYDDALKFARQATAARRAQIASATAANASADTSAGGQTAPVSQGELAHDLRVEAEMALRLGDLASARASGEEALWIVSEEPSLPLWWRADTVGLMAEINERDGRTVAAEHDYRDARDLDVKIFGDTAPTAAADLRLAEFYTRQQLYAPAMDAFRLATAIAAKDPIARAQLLPDDVVQYVAADMGNGAGDAARDADIFRVSQFANTGVADQTIARVAAREAAGNGALADLILKAQAAARDRDRATVDLAAEIALPDSERKSGREDDLNAQVKQASATADSLAIQVKQEFPQYAALANPGPADLAAVQAQLSPGDAMLIFIIGNDSSTALVVRHDGFAAVPLAIGQDALATDVADLRSAFVPAAGRLPQFSLKNSYALYQALVAPVESHLNGVDHLIVVPGGALSSLPLSLLVSQNPGDSHDYSNAAWLVKRFAISTMPSARALVTLHDEAEHHAPAARTFLGIGAPAFQGASGVAGAKALADLSGACRAAGPVPPDLLRALPPLPSTASEVQAVGRQIGGGSATILLGAQATEANLRAQPLEQYGVVYFATHGILPGELHCEGEPSLALSPPATPATSTATDGMLTASEIAQLKLNADLVVLSACNTAESGDGLGGGALEGLSDSFFAAGARSVLATHWEVPSAATAALMTTVFAPANRARGLAQALRQAQLSLIAQGAMAHPFNWAAFTIIGDGETIGVERSAQLTKGSTP
ncbi:MAG TPA: CHAT domain-containing protein [Candidatus Sulfotelmatobacter sp.]|nr:CHAT domain-containing protein [Candidatus Sulfotelmatobacter sp.]